MCGWIKLHRSLLEWEWWSDINTSRLFVYLIVKANHKPKKHRGATIDRGQLLTGRKILAQETGLSEQQIRSSLYKLKSTNEITIKATNKNSLITLVNYELYQVNESESTSKITSNPPNEQPASNHKQEVKNIKNKRIEVDFSPLCLTDEQIQTIKNIRKKHKGAAITQNVIKRLAKELELARNNGYTNQEIIEIWEYKGWRSLEAEWLKPKQQSNKGNEDEHRSGKSGSWNNYF